MSGVVRTTAIGSNDRLYYTTTTTSSTTTNTTTTTTTTTTHRHTHTHTMHTNTHKHSACRERMHGANALSMGQSP